MPRTLQVDEDRGDSEYHFAWLHDGGRTYDWQGANSYCSSLGRGWKGISIETREENDFVTDVIEHRNFHAFLSHTRTCMNTCSHPHGIHKLASIVYV